MGMHVVALNETEKLIGVIVFGIIVGLFLVKVLNLRRTDSTHALLSDFPPVPPAKSTNAQPTSAQYGLTDELVELLRTECTKNELFGEKDTKIRDTIVVVTLIGGAIGAYFGQPLLATKSLSEWFFGKPLVGLCLGFCCSLVVVALLFRQSDTRKALGDSIPKKYKNRYGNLPDGINLELLVRLAAYDDATAEWEEKKEAQRRLQKSHWLNLDGWAFEHAVAELIRKRGYKVQVTSGSGDGGIDLVITKQEKTIVGQCKNHAHSVGPATVRELYGAMVDDGAAEAWLIASSGVTIGAKKFVEGKPMQIFDLDDILRWEAEVQSLPSLA